MQKIKRLSNLCLKLYAIGFIAFFCMLLLGLYCTKGDHLYLICLTCSAFCLISMVSNEITKGSDYLEKNSQIIRCLLIFNTLLFLSVGAIFLHPGKFDITSTGAVLASILTVFSTTIPACISMQKNLLLHTEQLRSINMAKRREAILKAQAKPSDWTRYLPPNFSVIK